MPSDNGSNHIGRLNEQPLHAALKERYATPGAAREVTVDGFVIDVVRDDLLLEIQTGNFASVKTKMAWLAARHPVRLVYPIVRERWLLKLPKEKGGETERRKSPKRGRVEEVFKELVSFPELLCEETFSLEVALIQEEQLRRWDPAEGWRQNGWVTVESRLLDVVGRRVFRSPDDMASTVPEGLPERFTTADLAEALDGPRYLAQKMAYCLRRMGVITKIGNRGQSYLYVMGDG
ncbi:MAG: hypothetical protein PVJ55_07745 [Anaerolineae bacterium]